LELVRVTSEYSNAVLVAILPYISDVAQRLDLPVALPISQSQVEYCSVLPNRRVEAEVGIKGSWVFAFSRGYVRTIQSGHTYSMLQDPDEIPRFFGDLKISKSEAVQMARDTLNRLGIPFDSVFAEQEPHIGGPHSIGTNLVPHYHVVWPDPRGSPSVEIEINGQAKRVERICLSSKSLERPFPKLSVQPLRDPSTPVWPRVNPDYAQKLIPFALNAINEYGQKLDLPVPHPLTTNHVARFRVEEDRNSPHVEVYLTNGWRFDFNHTQVNGFYAPDDLFSAYSERRPILTKDFKGKWNMTEAEAKELVRKAMAKLEYPTNLVHFEVEAQVRRPAVPGIARFMFYWNYIVGPNDILQSSISAEVDADKRELKSLYFYDQSFYNRGPKIDVPLLLPATAPPPTTPFALPIGHDLPQRPITNVVPRR
jgi:hypothetical protein